ncbi:hypothetical protein SO802_003587 [Lithocarpus litseifolius]|uniref:Uncharacterized protein n=1 Tax=Lithocarpus litseifolius TaxID=425828 RepID=A0AAW2E0N5_9ROSI
MIVYEMCVLFFKMVVELRTWDANCEDLLCDFVFSHYVLGNLRPYSANAQVWEQITTNLNARTGKAFTMRRGNRGAANLRKQGCPDYPLLQQLFAPSTTTGNLQISSNTPPLNSDEERALEEELANANASAPTHLVDDCYTPNFKSFPQGVEDAKVKEETQRAGKSPVQDASGKGKKVSKKLDRVSEMTVTLKEYTAMTKDRFSGKLGWCSGLTDQFAQSAGGGDPCSLGKAMAVLNSYADLSNKVYIRMSKVLQQKDNRVVVMCMPEHRRKSWIEDILNPEED